MPCCNAKSGRFVALDLVCKPATWKGIGMIVEPECFPLPSDWYVLQLKPNGLKLAQTNLARQGYQTLMPMREVSQQARYGLKSVKRPLFSGYLFFGHAEGPINWRAIANTRGVTRVVNGTDGQPAPLPSEFANGLIQATAKDGMLIAMTDYRSGDAVSVINGPFSGWLARVIAADDEGRVRLLIDIMGRKTALEIASEDLEKHAQ